MDTKHSITAKTCVFSFPATDPHHIPKDLAEIPIATTADHITIDSACTPPANIATNLQQHPCEHSLYFRTNQPPQTGDKKDSCANCGTTATSQWRRDDEGKIECK
ncbi:hypothetical protein KIN20_037072 [Parelaphostrongylus tenuis]|uniref:GATA-type domain-containing protein n=1 Tax=Parelaphostrongylus tenuis TaxID=148309 RepID=A0AAD5WKW5_PARTN|nr:hypothetical protein KIN20_037072 [Parelaphostrongylus tenuis]